MSLSFSVRQVDGTCWMAYFSLCMLQIALELSYDNAAFVDSFVLYLDHFLSMAHALNFGLKGTGPCKYVHVQ